MVKKIGTNADESIVGRGIYDVILSGGGRDVIVGAGVTDVIYAGSGNNNVAAGGGNDTVWGGVGSNLLSGGFGDDVLVGSTGNDIFNGSEDDDIMSGEAGANVYRYKNDFGHDIITDFKFGVDKLILFYDAFGNQKNIVISSFQSLQKVISDYSLTVENLGRGVVKINFNADSSVTLMNAGSLFGFGATVANQAGTSGDDLIYGTTINNGFIVGASGNDTILLGSGSTQVEGNEGNDLIIGGAGNDFIGGQEGNDTIFGGAGRDILAGRTGEDMLVGGTGANTFYFHSSFGNDTVADLNFTKGDSLIFFGSIVPNQNVVVRSMSDLNNLKTLADDVIDDGMSLQFIFGSNSVTLLEFGGAGSGSSCNVITGTNNNDSPLFGTDMDDCISGLNGNDDIFAGTGNNTITGGQGTDYVGITGTGTNVLKFNNISESTTLPGGNGADYIGGFVQGRDKIDISALGYDSNDIIIRQFISGTGDPITFVASNTGDGFYVGFAGDYNFTINDFIWADSTLITPFQTDTIFGSESNDSPMYGTLDGDFVMALGGNDDIFTSIGNDTIIGGMGADYMGLQGGNNVLRYVSATESSDIAGGQGTDYVGGFVQGNDRIDVSSLGYSASDLVFGQFTSSGGSIISYVQSNTGDGFYIGFDGDYNFTSSDFIF